MPDFRLQFGRVSGACWSLLRALGRVLAGSWEALGRLLEASKRHLRPRTVMARVGRRVLRKKSKIWGGILASFSEGKLYILGFQEGIQDNDDFEGVLASIFGRFLKASERQK